MDTQLLKAFLQVAENGSFSAAADQLFLTQPAISKRVAALEQQLNCRLFDRISRRVTLTEAGRHLLPRARKILQEVADAERGVRDLSGSVSGQLKLGISHHIGLHRLPPILKDFSRRYPDVEFEIDFLDSEKAYERVTQGEIEVGVVTLAPEAQSAVKEFLIWDDPLKVMVANDHPLATQPTVTLADLTNHTAILPGQGTYTGQLITELFKQHQQKLPASMSTNYLETIKMMVSIGLGWSILPLTMQSREMTALEVPALEISRELGAIYHQDRTLSNAASEFVALLQASAGAHA